MVVGGQLAAALSSAQRLEQAQQRQEALQLEVWRYKEEVEELNELMSLSKDLGRRGLKVLDSGGASVWVLGVGRLVSLWYEPMSLTASHILTLSRCTRC